MKKSLGCSAGTSVWSLVLWCSSCRCLIRCDSKLARGKWQVFLQSFRPFGLFSKLSRGILKEVWLLLKLPLYLSLGYPTWRLPTIYIYIYISTNTHTHTHTYTHTHTHTHTHIYIYIYIYIYIINIIMECWQCGLCRLSLSAFILMGRYSSVNTSCPFKANEFKFLQME